MTGSMIAGAALLVAACGGGGEEAANNNVDINITEDLGNDTTVIESTNGTENMVVTPADNMSGNMTDTSGGNTATTNGM
jgi:hypothetical protein